MRSSGGPLSAPILASAVRSALCSVHSTSSSALGLLIGRHEGIKRWAIKHRPLSSRLIALETAPLPPPAPALAPSREGSRRNPHGRLATRGRRPLAAGVTR